MDKASLWGPKRASATPSDSLAAYGTKPLPGVRGACNFAPSKVFGTFTGRTGGSGSVIWRNIPIM